MNHCEQMVLSVKREVRYCLLLTKAIIIYKVYFATLCTKYLAKNLSSCSFCALSMTSFIKVYRLERNSHQAITLLGFHPNDLKFMYM